MKIRVLYSCSGLLALMAWMALSGSPSASRGSNLQSGRIASNAIGSLYAAVIPLAYPLPIYTIGPMVTVTNSGPEAGSDVASAVNGYQYLLAAVNDFSLRNGSSTIRYSYSTDNGNTWGGVFVPLSASGPVTSDKLTWNDNSSPSVAIDNLGNAFLGSLYYNTTNLANGVYVASTKFGATLTQANVIPVSVNSSATTTSREANPRIAVDTTVGSFSGDLYATWTHYTGCTSSTSCTSSSISFSGSSDHGITWSAPVQISSSAQNGTAQGSQVAVGPRGIVYVAYHTCCANNSNGQPTQGQIFLSKSTDGGKTFTAPAAAGGQFVDLAAAFTATYTLNSYPSIAVERASGKVMIVYSDFPSTLVAAQVKLIACGFDGPTKPNCSLIPSVVSDTNSGSQFMGAVTADTASDVHVAWYDTRNGTNPKGNTAMYDIYASYSTDDGTTFHQNARVTPTTINAGTVTTLGGYMGIAAGVLTSPTTHYAHPVWTNTTNNPAPAGNLQTATLSTN